MARTRLAFALAVACWLIATPGHAVVSPLTQPNWAELSPEQKRILAPLANEWDQMESFRRKKWIGIAQRYPKLGAEEQARMQRRMTEWAKLTPDERKQARDKYKSLQKAPPEKKAAVKQKWQEYKELPESEKARLKAEAAGKQTPRRGSGTAHPAGTPSVTSPATSPVPATAR